MIEKMQVDLGRELREARVGKNVSIYRLARDLGISEAAVRRCESGHGRMATIMAICNYLGVRLTVY